MTIDDVMKRLYRPPTGAIEWLFARVKLVDSGCLEWQLSISSTGYGKFNHRQRNYHAHRAVFELFNGPVPDGLVICHRCDNRRCCHPAHLFLGTSQDNAVDAFKKGRMSQFAKLNESQVLEVRYRVLNGDDETKLAREFNVSNRTIRRIGRRQTWQHVG